MSSATSEKENKIPVSENESDRVTDLVFLLHGIRSHGPWQQQVESMLAGYKNIRVVSIKYGWFAVPRFLYPPFLWPNFRKAPKRRVARELRSAMKHYPKANITVIAHSFGTYLVTEVLRENEDIRVYRVITCGSVVRQDFDWDEIDERIGPPGGEKRKFIINDCGNSDGLPVLAQHAGWGYGNAGTDGFGTVLATDRFHYGGHGFFNSKDFITKYWMPLIVANDVVAGVERQREEAPAYTKIAGGWMRWAILALAITAIYYGGRYGVPALVNWLRPVQRNDITFSEHIEKVNPDRIEDVRTVDNDYRRSIIGDRVEWEARVVSIKPGNDSVILGPVGNDDPPLCERVAVEINGEGDMDELVVKQKDNEPVTIVGIVEDVKPNGTTLDDGWIKSDSWFDRVRSIWK